MKLLRWNSVRPLRPQGNKTEPRASHRADRGWKSRKVSPLPVEGEIFFLTFPFIDPQLQRFLCPVRDWNGSDVPAFAGQVHDSPVLLAGLNLIEFQLDQL